MSSEDKAQCEDLKAFLFDEEQTIDVAALEAFITENRERLAAGEEDFQIDLSQMTVSAQRPQAAQPKQAEEKAQPA